MEQPQKVQLKSDSVPNFFRTCQLNKWVTVIPTGSAIFLFFTFFKSVRAGAADSNLLIFDVR